MNSKEPTHCKSRVAMRLRAAKHELKKAPGALRTDERIRPHGRIRHTVFADTLRSVQGSVCPNLLMRHF